MKKISLDISLKNAMTSNEQWADFRITSIMRLSLAIYSCAITSSIMDMFSADKSVANNTKIGSRLVADFAVLLLNCATCSCFTKWDFVNLLV